MLFSLYYAVILIGQSTMNPVSNIEFYFNSVTLTITSIFNAHLFGEVAVLISTFLKKTTDFTNKLAMANISMKNIGLPVQLQRDIREYIHKTVATRDKQEETDRFFDIIKPSLKVKVNNKLFEQNMLQNDLIRTLIGEPEFDNKKQTFWGKIIQRLGIKQKKAPIEDDLEKIPDFNFNIRRSKTQQMLAIQFRKKKYRYFIQNVINKLGTCFATPEEEVIVEGDPPAEMFFVSKGDCIVNIKDQLGNEMVAISMLCEGAFFGEIGMIYFCKRSATVISRNYNTFSRLDYSQYRDLVNEYPEFEQELKLNLYNYKDVFATFIKSMLYNLPFID